MILPAVLRARAALSERLARRLEPEPATAKNPFPAGAHPLDWRRSGLSTFARTVCAAATEALLADGEPGGALFAPPPEVVDRVVHKLDLWLGTGSPELSNAFVALTYVFEGVPTLLLKRPSRFTSLDLEDRLHVLEALESHPNGMLAMLLTAFKVPLCTVAYEEGDLLRETGFDRADLIERRNLVRPK